MESNTPDPQRPNLRRWDPSFRWRWLHPGIRLKRWIALFVFSGIVIGVGVSGSMGNIFGNFEIKIIDVRPLAKQIQSLRFIDFLLLALGLIGTVLAFRRGLY